jgi:hypothetical protein
MFFVITEIACTVIHIELIRYSIVIVTVKNNEK